MLYIYIYKLRNGGGVWTVKRKWKKKWDRWGGMYVCGGGEEKRKTGGYIGGR